MRRQVNRTKLLIQLPSFPNKQPLTILFGKTSVKFLEQASEYNRKNQLTISFESRLLRQMPKAQKIVNGQQIYSKNVSSATLQNSKQFFMTFFCSSSSVCRMKFFADGNFTFFPKSNRYFPFLRIGCAELISINFDFSFLSKIFSRPLPIPFFILRLGLSTLNFLTPPNPAMFFSQVTAILRFSNWSRTANNLNSVPMKLAYNLPTQLLSLRWISEGLREMMKLLASLKISFLAERRNYSVSAIDTRQRAASPTKLRSMCNLQLSLQPYGTSCFTSSSRLARMSTVLFSRTRCSGTMALRFWGGCWKSSISATQSSYSSSRSPPDQSESCYCLRKPRLVSSKSMLAVLLPSSSSQKMMSSVQGWSIFTRDMGLSSEEVELILMVRV